MLRKRTLRLPIPSSMKPLKVMTLQTAPGNSRSQVHVAVQNYARKVSQHFSRPFLIFCSFELTRPPETFIVTPNEANTVTHTVLNL